MTSESKLAIGIFVVLIIAIAVFWLQWQHHEASRPELLEARVVTSTVADPILRDGSRKLTADDELTVAVALRIATQGEDPYWLAPGESLELDGVIVDHVNHDVWPETDRIVRVFWFTVESSLVGGVLDPDNVMKRLTYRPFLAPEMGQGLVAEAPPLAHNTDHLGEVDGRLPLSGGTLRIYARVQVAEREGKIASTQAISSPGLEALMGPDLVTISRSAPLPPPLAAEVGELFLLPGWEGADTAVDEVIQENLGSTFAELIERRFVTSSQAFALLAVGAATVDDLSALSSLRLKDGDVLRKKARLAWSSDIEVGDILVAGQRWLVLIADNGNGYLDISDSVIWCHQRPAMASTLEIALGEATEDIGHYRRSPS